jgi:hypothetical protein
VEAVSMNNNIVHACICAVVHDSKVAETVTLLACIGKYQLQIFIGTPNILFFCDFSQSLQENDGIVSQLKH